MNAPDRQRLTDEETGSQTPRVLRKAKGSRPEVRVITLDGQLAVVKDYRPEATPFKRLLGVYLSRREAVALRRADGIPNVPRLLGMPTACSLAMSYLDAQQLTTMQSPQIDGGFFERLSALIARLHARGIAHGDLEKLDNILITRQGEPAICDFTSAILSGANPVAALAMPEVMENDRRAVVKLKAELAPGLLSEAEEEFLYRRGPLETWFRHWRKYIRVPAQRLSGTERDK